MNICKIEACPLNYPPTMDEDIRTMTPAAESDDGFSFDPIQAHEIRSFVGAGYLRPQGDQVLILGIRDTLENVATPRGEEDRLKRPGRGIILAHGYGVWETEKDEKGNRVHVRREDMMEDVWLGALCHFDKYDSVEMVIQGRKFYIIQAGKIRCYEYLPSETTFGKLLDLAY